MPSEGETSRLLESWGMPSIVIERFQNMHVTADLFPFLTENDLKELILRVPTRAKFLKKVHEIENAKNNAEKQQMTLLLASINAAIASLTQIIAQSAVATAATDAPEFIAAADAVLDAVLEPVPIPPGSPTLMPSTDDIEAINLAAVAHVAPPNYKFLAVLEAIEASVARRLNDYAVSNDEVVTVTAGNDERLPTATNAGGTTDANIQKSENDDSTGNIAKSSIASAVLKTPDAGGVTQTPDAVDVKKIRWTAAVPEHSPRRRQKHDRKKNSKIPHSTVELMIAGPSSKSTEIDANEEFAAALTLSLIAAKKKSELSEACKLAPILETEVSLKTSPPKSPFRDEPIPSYIVRPQRSLEPFTPYMPVFSLRRFAPIFKNETLYEELSAPSEED